MTYKLAMFGLPFQQIQRALKSWKGLPVWLKQRLSVGQQALMVRSVLGMTQEQLAKLMGTTQRAIVRLEKEEGDPQLSTLKRLAESLHCELLIRFVPKSDLEKLLKAKARSKAEQLVKMSMASANLELQKPSQEAMRLEINRLTEEILHKKRSGLWEK